MICDRSDKKKMMVLGTIFVFLIILIIETHNPLNRDSVITKISKIDTDNDNILYETDIALSKEQIYRLVLLIHKSFSLRTGITKNDYGSVSGDYVLHTNQYSLYLRKSNKKIVIHCIRLSENNTIDAEWVDRKSVV